MKYLTIILFVTFTLILGALPGFITSESLTSWYPDLNKPFFNPPNWIFGPAWTFLYICMGLAAALIYNTGFYKKEVKIALAVYSVQLILNIAWTFLFFGLKNPLLAFIEIVVLNIAIWVSMFLFKSINKTSFYLFIPYMMWVLFASALNLAFVLLN